MTLVDYITVKEPHMNFFMMGKENRHGDVPWFIYVYKFSVSFACRYQKLLWSSWQNWRRVHTKRHIKSLMGLLPDTQNCRLYMRWECRERFPRHRFQSKALVHDLGMHHGAYVTNVLWFMSGSLTRGGGKTFPAFLAHAQHTILRIC